MPNKIVNDLLKRFEQVEKDLHTHLIESGGIKAWLKINTWLTGIILASLLTQFMRDFFRK